MLPIFEVDPPSHPPSGSFLDSSTDLDDASHTDENDATEAERQSGSALDMSDYNNVGRHVRKRRLGTETDSEEEEEEELRSLDEFPVETTYVEQQEEEFGSVILHLLFFFLLSFSLSLSLSSPSFAILRYPSLSFGMLADGSSGSPRILNDMDHPYGFVCISRRGALIGS